MSERQEGGVWATTMLVQACAHCCTVVETGDYLGNRIEEVFASSFTGAHDGPNNLGQKCTDLPEYRIPNADWSRVIDKAPPLLVIKENKGRYLTEALASIIRFMKIERPDLIAARENAQGNVWVWMKILRLLSTNNYMMHVKTQRVPCWKCRCNLRA